MARKDAPPWQPLWLAPAARASIATIEPGVRTLRGRPAARLALPPLAYACAAVACQ